MNRADVDQLFQEVLAEIETYPGRTHGKRSTYTAGCHAPLCRKAQRDFYRDKNRRILSEAGYKVTPRPPTAAQLFDSFLAEWAITLQADREEELEIA